MTISPSTKRLVVLCVVGMVACALVAGTYYVVVLRHRTLPTAREVAFHNVTLTTEDGHSFDSTQLGKKPMIVATWATWCPSCTEMLVTLEKVKEIFGDRVEIIAVNRKEEKSTIDSFRAAFALPKNLTYVNDGSDAYFKNSDGRSMPEISIYDQNGNIREHALAAMSKDELTHILDDLLSHK